MEGTAKDSSAWIKTGILAIAIVGASFLLMLGASTAAKSITIHQGNESYELFGYGGVVYRINKVSGRTDILFPGSEGALLIPVWQMNPGTDSRGSMSEEEQANWNKVSKALSDYIKIAGNMVT